MTATQPTPLSDDATALLGHLSTGGALRDIGWPAERTLPALDELLERGWGDVPTSFITRGPQ